MSIDLTPTPVIHRRIPYPHLDGSITIAYRPQDLQRLWRPLQVVARAVNLSTVYLLAVLLAETALHPDPDDPARLQPLPLEVAGVLHILYQHVLSDTEEPWQSIMLAANHLAWNLFHADNYMAGLAAFRYGPRTALQPDDAVLAHINDYAGAVAGIHDWLKLTRPWRRARPSLPASPTTNPEAGHPDAEEEGDAHGST